MFLRLIGMTLLFGSLVNAGGFSLLDYRLSALKEGKTVDLSSYRGKPLYMTFFKSGCRWCDKQLAAFEALMEAGYGTKIDVVAVALGSDIMQLRKMARRVSFKALRASPELLHDIGGVAVTPYTLVIDADGKFITKIVGYQNSDQLKKITDATEHLNEKGE